MRRYLYAFTVLLWLSVRAVAGNVDYVNMYVGTDAPNEYNYAGIWPQVGAPFAMTGWSAATQRNCISATVYRYIPKRLVENGTPHESDGDDIVELSRQGEREDALDALIPSARI